MRSMVVYGSFLDATKDLDAETFKEIWVAILQYGIDSTRPKDLSAVSEMAFRLISPNIDVNLKRRKKANDDNCEQLQTIADNCEQKPTASNDGDVDKENKEKVITNVITKEKDPKHQYGEYKHVWLTDAELERLNKDYGIDKTAYAIKWFDAYIEEKGYKCKSHNLAMRRWVFDAIERDKKPPVSRSGTTKPNWNIEKRDYDMEDLEAQLLRRSL